MMATMFIALMLWFVAIGNCRPSVFYNEEQRTDAIHEPAYSEDTYTGVARADDNVADLNHHYLQALPHGNSKFAATLTSLQADLMELSEGDIAYISDRKPTKEELLHPVHIDLREGYGRMTRTKEILLPIGRFGDFCTGTVIADNAVLTAAHCVYKKGKGDGGFVTKERNFYRAKNCGDPDYVVETHTIDEYIIHEDYRDNEKTEFDFAILKIANNAKSPPLLGIVQLKSVRGTKISVVGYSEKKYNPDECMQHSSCHIEEELDPGKLYYPCEVHEGMSGGPILDGTGHIIGVHSAGWDGNDKYEYGEGVLLTEDRVNILKEWVTNPGSGVRHDLSK